ncbi:MAG: glycyl radical enzyme domain-containing protein [Blautia sp.]|jgi:pyruvate-formate lyase
MGDNLKEISMFSLEDFMKSITYPPDGMTTNLARAQVMASDTYEWIPDREVEILRKALMTLPIGINDEDTIAGNYGPKFAEDALLSQIREADTREYGNSEEYKVRDEEERIASGRYMLFGIYTPSHTCADYERILKYGLKDYERRIDQRLEQSIDAYGKSYLQAMKKTIDVTREYTGRFLTLAEEKLKKADSEAREWQLKRMIAALRRVPYEPASDLFEALQSMWIIHTVIPASERSWASISFGRMDVYLAPYYRKWLEDGNTKEEAIALLGEFFKLFDSYGDGSCALNLGPEWSETTELLLEVEKTVKLRSPIIAARMGKEDAPYQKLVDKELFEIGQPTFYGEEACQRAMLYRGMTKEEGFSVNSCMGMVVVGKELADMWGCCLNMNLPLELAVNGGKPLHGELPSSVQKYVAHVPVRKPDSMEQIKASYQGYVRALAKYVASKNQQRAAWVAWNRPNPFLSMLLDDCITYGRDRAHSALHALGEKAREIVGDCNDFEQIRQGRGAHYHNVTMLAMGFAHAADALTAIEKLVFEERVFSLEELIEAAANNYEGKLEYAKIFSRLRHMPKYADGSDEADDMVQFVLNALADACEACYDGNIRYLPTCHTIDSNVQFGQCVYASLDSRKDGEAFGKNAGPVMSAIKNTPTDLIVSAAKIPQHRFSGGVPIDIYVPENLLAQEEGQKKFRDLLKVYFQKGGMQVQVNSVSIDLLKKAYDHPEEYPHVIVRKGGFSLYFTDMLKEVQKDMIERFEMEVSK